MRNKESKKKVYAIVQARMSSSRLPGKVLMDLCGKPILWHIINRLRECNTLNDVVIATSTSRLDNQIVKFAKRYEIKYFRGNEEDVLKRYIDAATFFKANFVLRVTGDAPLIEPNEIDRLVRLALKNKAGFCIGDPNIPTVHVGFSFISLNALQEVYEVSDLKDYHKEHVSIYLREKPNFVKTVYFKPKKIFQKWNYRLTVDTMSDLNFVRMIFRRFWDKKNIVDLKQVIAFLEKNPHFKNINIHVVQKKPQEKSRKAAFIIEGGEKLGFGHFTRTTQIAKYLTENKNYGIIFIVNNKLLNKKIKDLGFKTFLVLSHNVEGMDLESIYKIVKKEKADLVTIDVKSNHDPSGIVIFFKKALSGIKIILIDNKTKARLLADKNIYPVPEKLISDFNWRGYKGRVYAGLEFFPLRQEFVKAKNNKKDKDSIAITMGGSDPNNITTFVMESLIKTGKKVKVIIGPAFKHKERIKTTALRFKDTFELYEEPDDYAQIIASSSLLITALGISVYEFSYFKIPTLVIGSYKDDVKIGKRLENLGYCKFLGYYKNFKKEALRKNILTISRFNGHFPPREIPDRKGVERLVYAVLN